MNPAELERREAGVAAFPTQSSQALLQAYSHQHKPCHSETHIRPSHKPLTYTPREPYRGTGQALPASALLGAAHPASFSPPLRLPLQQ